MCLKVPVHGCACLACRCAGMCWMLTALAHWTPLAATSERCRRPGQPGHLAARPGGAGATSQIDG